MGLLSSGWVKIDFLMFLLSQKQVTKDSKLGGRFTISIHFITVKGNCVQNNQ
jgi:hypothetical protein